MRAPQRGGLSFSADFICSDQRLRKRSGRAGARSFDPAWSFSSARSQRARSLCHRIRLRASGAKMRRREFIVFLGGASAAWSLAAQAQQRAMPVVGFLSSGSPRAFAKFLKVFQNGLSQEGFVEGRNLAIIYRWAEGHFDELDALATELVADGVALIAATGGIRSAKSAKNATATIPIVFVLGVDPVKLGLVASFNKPGGNITGT